MSRHSVGLPLGCVRWLLYPLLPPEGFDDSDGMRSISRKPDSGVTKNPGVTSAMAVAALSGRSILRQMRRFAPVIVTLAVLLIWPNIITLLL